MCSRLSGSGVFTGAEQSRMNKSKLDLRHLQACTFDFFFVLFLSWPPFPHTLMAACLKATAGSYREGSPLHSRLHFLSLLVHLVAMDTIKAMDTSPPSYFFFIIFSLLNVDDFGFGGHIIFSYYKPSLCCLFLLSLHTNEGRLCSWLCFLQPYIRLLLSGSHGKGGKKA